MWSTFLIQERERGILTVDGRARAWLEPGRHRFLRWGRKLAVEIFDLDAGFAAYRPELARVVPREAYEDLLVDRGEVALVDVDGQPKAFLLPGRYLLWQLRAATTALVKSTAAVVSDVPHAYWALAPDSHLSTFVIRPYERAVLYVDGHFQAELSEGAFAVFCDDRDVRVVRVDLREREITIAGQEVMTSDKVSLRLSLVVKLAVASARASVERTADLDAAIYAEAQMVARRFIAGATIDVLLERRNDIASSMRTELAARAEAWGVSIASFDIKDYVLPGDMKLLLNRVIEAEKQAAANNILRREETAATRSLANTARMLEQSPTLMRLKELETYKELAERVGKITLVTTTPELLGGLRVAGPGDKQRA